MIEQELVAHIKDNVPSLSGRFFAKMMPQNSLKPAVVYSVINDSDIETLGCVIGSDVRFQLDIYAESYAEVKLIKEEVKQALYSFKYKPFNLSSMDDYEDETKLYREMLDFKIKY
jgi:hypothetical protein